MTPEFIYWLTFYTIVNATLIILAVIFFISACEDCFIDLCYWGQRAYRAIRHRKYKSFKLEDLRRNKQKKIAIMVPAWKEAEVIAQMLQSNVRYIDYKEYHFFVGTYKNDLETQMEVDYVVASQSNVHKVVVPHDGPTCKADCLNWIIQSIFLHEKKHKMQFDMFVMHDAEDVIHPIEFLLFNHMVEKKDFIQIPVRALHNKESNMISGIYMDEFAECHTKDMIVRETLCGIIPSAGVASCFSRRAISILNSGKGGEIFNTNSLTEDYDISYRLSQHHVKQIFALFHVDVTLAPNILKPEQLSQKRLPIAVAEYFPSKLWTAIRQRTRWNIGIFFQSAGRMTWSGGFWKKYFFLHDRKGILVNLLVLPAMVVFLVLAAIYAIGYFYDVPRYELALPTWLIYCNLFFMVHRMAERFYFTTASYSLAQGFFSVPRVFVSNLVNFCATSRAVFIYVRYLINKIPITWDKTTHVYPSMEALETQYKEISDILLEHKLIDSKSLMFALKQQKKSDTQLGLILLENGLITEEKLMKALQLQTSYPRAKLVEADLQKSCHLLPFDFIKKYSVFPLGVEKVKGKKGRVLKVGIAKPLSERSLDAICAQGFIDVKPYAVLNKNLDKLMEKYCQDKK